MKELILKLIKEKKEDKTLGLFCEKRICDNCTIEEIRKSKKDESRQISCDTIYDNIEKEIKSNINKY